MTNETKTSNKIIVISERDNLAALFEDGKVVEFFIHRGDMLLGDVYLATVENILPSIDAAFVNLGADRMGFLHASDVPGKGDLKERLEPKQKVLVQIMKEPTGHKGPRVSTSLSLPGRFLVLMPEEKGISISRKILSPKERSRLKSIVNLLKPAGVGVIIRTEAESQTEEEIKEDIETLLEKWQNIVTTTDSVSPPALIHRDQDLLYRVIREACTDDVKEIFIDTPFGQHRVNQLIQTWNLGKNIKVNVYKGSDSLLIAKGIDKEIKVALQSKVNLPSGGYLYIQPTEALTVIDVNSGKFTSSQTQNETIRQTNLEAVEEIARQLRLRNIGGMIVIDYIDMENRVDRLAILEAFEMALLPDKAKPQIGQLSDLGLVELTRHRQGQSLMEIFTKKCPACGGSGAVIEDLNFAPATFEVDHRMRSTKPKVILKPKSIIPSATIEEKPEGSPTLPSKPTLKQKPVNIPPIPPKPQAKPAAPIPQKQITDSKPKEPLITTIKPVEPEKQTFYKKQDDIENIENLSINNLRNVYKDKKHYPELSKIVRFSGVPLKTAKEMFEENVNLVDVFTILGEMDAAFVRAAQYTEAVPIITPTLPETRTEIVIAEENSEINEDASDFKGRYGVSSNGENFEELYEVIEEDNNQNDLQDSEQSVNSEDSEEVVETEEAKDKPKIQKENKLPKRPKKPTKPLRGRPKTK